MTTGVVSEYIDCCLYNGDLYTLNVEGDGSEKKLEICRIEWDGEGCETIYEDSFECKYKYTQSGQVSDLYASEHGVFFRKYISEEKGCGWFRLTKDEETKKWRAEEWEDDEKIPVALPAQNIDYEARRSVSLVLESTEGYESYLADDLK